jgi:hypothetical protein
VNSPAPAKSRRHFTSAAISGNDGGMTDRSQKITFAEMRDMGVRGVLVYCADYLQP